MAVSVLPPATDTRSDECVVAVRGLKKEYRDGSEALRGVDLEIAKGELFGIVGPDGAGKTTTLNILSGVVEASAGDVLILGSQPRKARGAVGYVTQTLSLYRDLSVEENLRYDAGLAGVSNDEFSERKQRYLEQMGLALFSDRPAGELSGGMAHKLALCCALISQPRLLLLDEPTTGLDPLSRREVWRILEELVRDGVTVLVATPYFDEAESCGRVALLYEGKIHEIGAPRELENALGVRRFELAFDNLDSAERALSSLSAKRLESIVDIYTVGLRLDVLVKDSQEAERDVRALLSEEHIPKDVVTVGEPTLENVFAMRLRDEGRQESRPEQHPEKRNDRPGNNEKRDGGAAIVAKDLCKRFKDFQAVDRVNLEIEYGEIFGLLGANGAGKTTTIKMLCGLIEPTSGTVSLVGESRNLRSRKVRRRAGYMSQRFTLYPGLTVRENLEFYVSVYEIPLARRKEIVDWALEVGDLDRLAGTLVSTLPRGWKQRVAFGAAIMHEPEVLFLDEPTAGLDPIARRQMWGLIRDVARHGSAVLVSTHYLDEAEYCNRLGLLVDGEIVAQGSPLEIKGAEESLEEAFISIVGGNGGTRA